MNEKVIIPIVASFIMFGLGCYIIKKLKESYTFALVYISFISSIWQFLVGIEQLCAISNNVELAQITSQILGIFAQSLPAFLFLFVFKFINPEKKIFFPYIIIFLCVISGLLSFLGTSTYEIENGNYIVTHGWVFLFHNIWFIAISFFSLGYLLWKRYINSDMNNFEAQKANIFIIGFAISFFVGWLLNFFFLDMRIRMVWASITPLLIIITALIGSLFTRQFIFKSYRELKFINMPKHISFEGEYSEEREILFQKYGMLIEVKKDIDYYIKYHFKNKIYLFPESIIIPADKQFGFPLAIVFIQSANIYVLVQSKNDGIVRKGDLQKIEEVFGDKL